MDKNIIDYAWSVLKEHDCDEYTYGGEFSKHVLDDLKEAYPDGMKYPYIDVANAILSFSRAKPIYKAPFMMVWDTDSCCDGIECESFEEAKADAEDTLIEWACEEMRDWNGMPTEEQIESYDYMYYNCSVRVDKYNPDTDEYEEYWSPSYEDEKTLGWQEWNDIKETYEAYLKEE